MAACHWLVITGCRRSSWRTLWRRAARALHAFIERTSRRSAPASPIGAEELGSGVLAPSQRRLGSGRRASSRQAESARYVNQSPSTGSARRAGGRRYGAHKRDNPRPTDQEGLAPTGRPVRQRRLRQLSQKACGGRHRHRSAGPGWRGGRLGVRRARLSRSPACQSPRRRSAIQWTDLAQLTAEVLDNP